MLKLLVPLNFVDIKQSNYLTRIPAHGFAVSHQQTIPKRGHQHWQGISASKRKHQGVTHPHFLIRHRQKAQVDIFGDNKYSTGSIGKQSRCRVRMNSSGKVKIMRRSSQVEEKHQLRRFKEIDRSRFGESPKG